MVAAVPEGRGAAGAAWGSRCPPAPGVAEMGMDLGFLTQCPHSPAELGC